MKKYRWYISKNLGLSMEWIDSTIAPDFKQLEHCCHSENFDIYRGVNGFFWKREAYYEVSNPILIYGPKGVEIKEELCTEHNHWLDDGEGYFCKPIQISRNLCATCKLEKKMEIAQKDVGKYFKTRCGRQAYILTIAGNIFDLERPIIGLIRNIEGTAWQNTSWYRDGSYSVAPRDPNDLIEPWEEPQQPLGEWELKAIRHVLNVNKEGLETILGKS